MSHSSYVGRTVKTKQYPQQKEKKKKVTREDKINLAINFVSKYGHKDEFKTITPANKSQQIYYDYIQKYKIVLCTGDAGTGKTLLPLYYAFCEYKKQNINKIYYINPNIGTLWENDLGFLAGDLEEKINQQLLEPVKSNLIEFMSESDMNYNIKTKIIEAKPLRFIRGATLKNCVVLIDECQLIPPDAMLTILTRRGINTKFIFVGSHNQRVNMNVKDGILDAKQKLGDLENDGVGIFEFKRSDIIRDGGDGLTAKILNRYGV